ncbi:MAG: hypothetical protein R3214_10075 [Christiangramia sp.]|nr:hypothetical protein [Christiangramia sp.]
MKKLLPVKGKMLRTLVLTFCLFVNSFLALAQTDGTSATVTTDKADYSPGEYVIITGSGWIPGETVSFIFEETPKPETCVNSHDYNTLVDAQGDIYYDQFLIKQNHLGVHFLLTATGQTSGYIAQTEFTDANSKLELTSPATAEQGSYIILAAKLTQQGGGAASGTAIAGRTIFYH